MKSLIRKSDDQELHLCVSSLGTAAATTRTSQVNGRLARGVTALTPDKYRLSC